MNPEQRICLLRQSYSLLSAIRIEAESPDADEAFLAKCLECVKLIQEIVLEGGALNDVEYEYLPSLEKWLEVFGSLRPVELPPRSKG